jgi:hypothetical protein
LIVDLTHIYRQKSLPEQLAQPSTPSKYENLELFSKLQHDFYEKGKQL